MSTSFRTIADAAAALRSGATTSVELTDQTLVAFHRHQAQTNAFIRVDAEAAREAARAADAERARGVDRGPLHGVPLSLKDLIDIAGQPTTAASRVLKDSIAEQDAPVVVRLRDAGAVLFGKTNLHEFAFGTTSEESAWGPVRHPRDAARSAGGSSGGSAAAVATGMGLASIGTDTGGSIRIPAAACGVVGLKPSVGDVPTSGVVPLSPSLDHVGPLARTVSDAAWVWAIIAGRPIAAPAIPLPRTLRLSRLDGYFSRLSAEVRAAFDHAVDHLRSAGVAIIDATIANAERIAPDYVNIVLPEAAVWHARYLETQSSAYTPGVRARLESGRSIRAVDYVSARRAQAGLRRAVDAALAGCDALVLPTLPIVAPILGTTDVALDASASERLPIRSAMLRQTQLFNMTGHPAISLPLRTPGLPVGLQLVGPRDGTARLLAVAAAIEPCVCPAI